MNLSGMRQSKFKRKSCKVVINFDDCPRIQVIKDQKKVTKAIAFHPKLRSAFIEDKPKVKFHFKPNCLDLVYEFMVHRMPIKRIAEKHNRSLSNTYKIIKLFLTDETVKMPKHMRINRNVIETGFIDC